MRVVDPLRIKMHGLLLGDSAVPLELARMSYGSKQDYDLLVNAVDHEHVDTGEPVVVDLTPLTRLGNPDALRAALESGSSRLPLTILVRDGGVLEALHRSRAQEICQIAVFSHEGGLTRWEGTLSDDTRLEGVRSILTERHSLKEIRQSLAERRLLELLSGGGVVHAHPGCGIPSEDLIESNGRWYMRMPNLMLVTCYLDLKRALSNPERLTEMAYEVILTLYSYFVADVEPGRPYDAIVVPNNTALMIGSAVQALTGIPVCVVDKLGPIPSRHIADVHTSIDLRNKEVCLLVEVAATGGELDRAIMFLSSRHATVRRVIACYDLQVGRSMLVSNTVFQSLCRPKRELGYEYKSET